MEFLIITAAILGTALLCVFMIVYSIRFQNNVRKAFQEVLDAEMALEYHKAGVYPEGASTDTVDPRVVMILLLERLRRAKMAKNEMIVSMRNIMA